MACAVSGALLWGTLGPVAAVLDERTRLAAVGLRMLLGAVTLFALGGRRLRRTRWRRADVPALVAGAVGVAGFQFAYFAAIGATGVAVTTAISIGLAPVFTGLWTALRTHRRPSLMWLAGTSAAVGGLVLLAFGNGIGVHVSVLGLLLSVVSAACFCAQVLAIQALAGRYGEAGSLTAMFAGGALLLAPATVPLLHADMFVGRNLVALLYLGVAISGGAYWLFSHGVRHLGAAAAVTISLLEPVGAAAIAATVLGQHLTTTQWLGMAVVCGAIVVEIGRAHV